MRHTDAFWLRRLLRLILMSTVVGLLIVYAIWQSRLLILGPLVNVTTEPSMLQTERTVTITGTAENITSINLNGRPIATTREGVFQEQIVLESGYTIATIEATDRYGRRVVVTRSYMYRPDTESAQSYQ